MPRLLVLGAVAVLCAAGARAVVLPMPIPAPAAREDHVGSDPQAEAFAQAFARAYLTWDGARPERRERALSQLMSSELASDGGAGVPRNARQRVSWTRVTESAPAAAGRRVGVDAGTDRGEWHLSVLVRRDHVGRLTVATYPALTGPQATTSRVAPDAITPVTDHALLATARRVVRNYLGRARENLAADLAPRTSVVLPDRRLTVRSIVEVGWVASGRSVRVEAAVQGRDRVVLTLTYDLAVTRRAGRWLVRSLLSTPSPKEKTP